MTIKQKFNLIAIHTYKKLKDGHYIHILEDSFYSSKWKKIEIILKTLISRFSLHINII
jgi:hypothetical protein